VQNALFRASYERLGDAQLAEHWARGRLAVPRFCPLVAAASGVRLASGQAQEDRMQIKWESLLTSPLVICALRRSQGIPSDLTREVSLKPE
jgi:hypothetical protein